MSFVLHLPERPAHWVLQPQVLKLGTEAELCISLETMRARHALNPDNVDAYPTRQQFERFLQAAQHLDRTCSSRRLSTTLTEHVRMTFFAYGIG